MGLVANGLGIDAGGTKPCFETTNLKQQFGQPDGFSYIGTADSSDSFPAWHTVLLQQVGEFSAESPPDLRVGLIAGVQNKIQISAVA